MNVANHTPTFTYALVSKYEPISDMCLITHEYGISEWLGLPHSTIHTNCVCVCVKVGGGGEGRDLLQCKCVKDVHLQLTVEMSCCFTASLLQSASSPANTCVLPKYTFSNGSRRPSHRIIFGSICSPQLARISLA